MTFKAKVVQCNLAVEVVEGEIFAQCRDSDFSGLVREQFQLSDIERELLRLARGYTSDFVVVDWRELSCCWSQWDVEVDLKWSSQFQLQNWLDGNSKSIGMQIHNVHSQQQSRTRKRDSRWAYSPVPLDFIIVPFHFRFLSQKFSRRDTARATLTRTFYKLP